MEVECPFLDFEDNQFYERAPAGYPCLRSAAEFRSLGLGNKKDDMVVFLVVEDFDPETIGRSVYTPTILTSRG